MVVNELKIASGINHIIHRKKKKVHTQRISETIAILVKIRRGRDVGMSEHRRVIIASLK